MSKANFKEIIRSSFFKSVFLPLVFLECLVFLHLIYQGRDAPIELLWAVGISFFHLAVFLFSYYRKTNLYSVIIPLSAAIVFYINSTTSLNFTFSAYYYCLIFYTLLFIQSNKLKVFYLVLLIGLNGFSQVLKGREEPEIYIILLVSLTFGFLLYNVLKYFTQTQKTLEEQSKKIRNSEENLKNLLENSTSSIAAIDTNYNIIYANNGCKRIFSHRLNKTLGKGDNLISSIGNIELQQRWRAILDKGLKGETFLVERNFDFDEGKALFEFTLAPMKNEEGNQYGVVIFGRDITAKRAIQQKIRDNEALLNRIIDNMPIGFELFDSDRKSIRQNEKKKEIREQESKGEQKILSAFKDCDTQQSIQKYYDSIFETKQIVSLEKLVDFSNNPHWNNCHPQRFYTSLGFPVCNEEQEVNWAVVLTQDVTEKRLDAELLKEQNKKLEAFAFTTSHIIRRPVANLLGLTSLIEPDCVMNPEDQQLIVFIKESAEQLDVIIRDLSNTITE